jgi:hypothetical protein
MVDAVHERFNIDLHGAVGAWHDFAQALGSCPTVSVGTSSRRFSAIACAAAMMRLLNRHTSQDWDATIGETLQGCESSVTGSDGGRSGDACAVRSPLACDLRRLNANRPIEIAVGILLVKATKLNKAADTMVATWER